MAGLQGWLRLLIMVAYIISGLAFPHSGYCGPSNPGKVAQQQDREATQTKEEQGEDTPRRLIQMNEIQIRGEVEKPKAMFIIPRATTDYPYETKKRDFTEEILAPVDMQRLEDMARNQDLAR